MRFFKYAAVVALLFMVPSVAMAQTRFEVSPFFGWRQGNDVGDISGVSIDLDSGATYGFMVDVGITDNLYGEFIYSYRKTDGSVFIPPDVSPTGPVGTFDITGNVDYYQGGLLYQFQLRNPMVKPYIVGTLGAGSFRSMDQSSTNFSLSGGAGVKLMFSRNVGVRGEYRLFSTSTSFTGVGGWCDWWGFCYTFLTDQYLYQSQFSAAIILAY